jgi:GT2 family glycosyltransferase
MDKRKLVGIVTVTYNSTRVLHDFLVSILKQRYQDFALYVIDNASSDKTVQRLREYHDPRIVLIQNSVNAGVAAGNNIGIRAALKDGCDFVLLINNDTVFDSDLLLKLTEGLEEHKCDIIVPKISFYDNPDTIWYGGGYFNRLRACGNHFGLGQRDEGQFDVARRVSYSPTCCMLIRCEVFQRIGFMDASYFLYFDDTDFCLRAYRSGIKLFYLPLARVLHKESSLTGGYSEFTIRYITRNHMYYLLKHYLWWQVCFYGLLFYLYLPAKYLFLLRRPRIYWVAQKAYWEGISLFVSNLGRIERKVEPTHAP